MAFPTVLHRCKSCREKKQVNLFGVKLHWSCTVKAKQVNLFGDLVLSCLLI